MPTLLGNTFSRLLSNKAFYIPTSFRSKFCLQTKHISFKVNFHDVRCDVVMTSSTDQE